jgi:Zn finger protein HypA/HybF involved in hydrogenase expression
MHELGIAKRILEVALARAHEAGAKRVTALEVEIGDDAGIDEESITTHWRIVSASTIAQGADLRVRHVHEPPTTRLVAIDVEADD